VEAYTGLRMPSAEHIAVTPELLDKYDRPGPRYTSYPTAPEWNPAFSVQDYEQALSRANAAAGSPLSVYVHLPFCHERCLFCGCNVVISKRQDISDQYLNYLEMEIDRVAARLPDRRRVEQLHWGGGTPTYLRLDQIERLHAKLADVFDFGPSAEIALEVDPRVTTREQLELLRSLGFNRISMGVQDLDRDVQRAINRNQTEAETRTLFDQCRELGFGGINIDLIYGLPEQTAAGWARTIEATIDIRPDRLAVYSYAHLPNML